MLYLMIFILAANLVSLLLCGIDKRRALRGGRRVAEKTLLLWAACGGCFGLLLGMIIFRHKTRQLKFRLLAPLLCILWLAVVVYAALVLAGLLPGFWRF